MLKHTLAAAATAVVLTGVALPASAHVHHTPPASSVTIRFSDHSDGGNGGTWAKDSGQAQLTTKKTGTDTYTATLSLEGSFVTIPGAFTPNQSSPYTGDTLTASRKVGSSATITGSVSYSFTSDEAPAWVTGTVVTTGDLPRLSDWYKLPFDSSAHVSGGITHYSFVYRLKCPLKFGVQTWTETDTNGDGNAPGDGNIFGC